MPSAAEADEAQRQEKEEELTRRILEKFKGVSNTSIFNLSSYPLSPLERILLGLGLKYIPTPSRTTYKDRYFSLKRSVAKLDRRLKLAFHFFDSPSKFDPYIPFNSHAPPWQPDLPPHIATLIDSYTKNAFYEARKQLSVSIPNCSDIDALIHKTLHNLLTNPAIVIKPADKNLGLCIMNRVAYKIMCLKHLNDTSTYLRIDSFNPTQCFDALRAILIKYSLLYSSKKRDRSEQHLTLSRLAACLLQLNEPPNHPRLRVAPFYCLPKLHKSYSDSIPPGRPIVSSQSTVTYYTSQYLDKRLQPFIKSLNTPCSSSRSVIRDMHDFTVPTDSVFLCADVRSLYPSIPIDYGLHLVRHTLTNHPEFFSPDDVNLILDLLEWVLKNNYIIFDDSVYLQIKGTAMGTPTAVSYATIVLYAMEKPILTRQPMLYYRRYIDDIFAITSRDSAIAFVNDFNSLNTSIQLESVTQDGTGIFLDLQFSFQEVDNVLHVHHTIYQKPLNKYQYIPPMSLHKSTFFDNFIVQELSRYRLACSSPDDYDRIVPVFIERLLCRGYSPLYIFPLLNKVPARDNLLQKLLTHTTVPREDRRLQSPLIVLDLPPLSPRPNWSYIFQIPADIRRLGEYKRAFSCTNVMIGTRNPPNIAKLTTRSNFASTSPTPHS
jgi:hypothetical protein